MNGISHNLPQTVTYAANSPLAMLQQQKIASLPAKNKEKLATFFSAFKKRLSHHSEEETIAICQKELFLIENILSNKSQTRRPLHGFSQQTDQTENKLREDICGLFGEETDTGFKYYHNYNDHFISHYITALCQIITTLSSMPLSLNLYTQLLIFLNNNPAPLNTQKEHLGDILFKISLIPASLDNNNMVANSFEELELTLSMAGKNFGIVNFSHKDLSGVNFTGATFSAKTDFSHSKLEKTNFTDAKMPKAILKHAKMIGTILNGAQMVKADCQYVTMSDIHMIIGNLTKINLCRAKIKNSTFQWVNFSDAQIQHAKLFNDVKIKNCFFIGTNFTATRFEKVSFLEAVFYDHVYQSKIANLTHTKWIEATLFACDLTNTDCSNANMKHANLTHTIFKNAILSWVNLKGANICCVDFHKATLTNAIINLSFLTVKDFDYDGFAEIWLNHFTRGDSLFTAINSMNEPAIKVALFTEFINWFHNNENFAENERLIIFAALKDILFSDIIYLQDDTLRNYTHSVIMDNCILQAHLEPMRKPQVLEMYYMTDYIHGLSQFAAPLNPTQNMAEYFMLNNNNYFNQLIYWCCNSQDYNLRNKATQLYNFYLSIPYIKRLVDICGVELYYFVGQPSSDSPPESIAMEESYLQKFFTHDHSLNFNQLYHFANIFAQQLNVTEVGKIDLSGIFKTFKIFAAAYNYQPMALKLNNLLESLNLGNYKTDFINASKLNSFTTKYVELEQQTQLDEIFNKVLLPNNACSLHGEDLKQITIAHKHLNILFDIYDLNDKDNELKAKFLLCIAALIIRYTSKRFLGTENDSPRAPRYYASALLKEGKKLYPNLIDTGKYNTWIDKLLGLNNQFSCAELLFTDIINECKEICLEILQQTLPMAWR